MTSELPFIVVFNDVEVGRYDSPEAAIAAARSVVETESARVGGFVPAPVIFWQPPRVRFPYDISVEPPSGDHQRPAPEVRRPTMRDPYGETVMQPLPAVRRPPPDPVYGGPPRPPRPAPRPAPPAPVYGGPPAPPPAPVYGGPPAPPAKKRWFGKHKPQ